MIMSHRHPSIDQLPLHPDPSITQFVRSTPVTASPLMVLKSVSQSEDGLINILRLIESSVKSYVYLNTWIRPSNSAKKSNHIRYARILIGLSFISIVHRSKELIKITRAQLLESHSNGSANLFPPQDSTDRLSSSNQLKSTLESASNFLKIIINLLDDLTFLNHLGVLKVRLVNNISNQTSNALNVILNILDYSKSSVEKAEIWKIGRDTRTLILETDKIIQLNKRAIHSQSNLSPVSSTIRPTKSHHEQDQEEELNQPPSLQEQINLDIKINRSRKLVLKSCKRSLDRIFWSRIVFLIDGLVSAYDLLELQCASHGVRTLIELISSILDFKSSYSQALESYLINDHPGSR